jgi:type IV pilus assembly protein PilA
MKFWNKMKKNSKGFTLVEIIVVLVILAVLAAFTIPSMLGFVNEAKRKAAIAEQREVYVAAQAIVTERFAKEGSTDALTTLDVTLSSGEGEAVNLGSAAVASASDTGTSVASEMKNYLSEDLDPKASGAEGSIWTVTIDSNGRVKEVTYTRDGVVLEPLTPSSDL